MTISIKDYRFGHARVGVVHIIGPPPFDEAKAFKVYIASYLKIDLEINQSRLTIPRDMSLATMMLQML